MAKPTAAEIAAWQNIADVLAGIEDLNNATNVNCPGCIRCKNSKNSTNCEDSVNVVSCNGARFCKDSYKLVQCRYLKNCYDCVDCKGNGETDANYRQMLFKCRAVNESSRCIGMENAQAIENMICGTSVSAAEFDRVWEIIEADQIAKMVSP